MILINSEPYDEGYKVRVGIMSNKEQECCELFTFIRFVIKHDPEMLNAVLDELMSEVTESTYEMDPEQFAAYKMLLEGMQ